MHRSKVESTRRPRLARREFLGRSVLAAASAHMAASQASAAIVSAKSATIQPKNHGLMRVRIEIDVKGNANVSTDAIASKNATKQFPVTSKAILDYEERALRPANAVANSPVVATERYYHAAENDSTLNKLVRRQQLRSEMRHAIVRRESLPESIYSTDSFYTQDELSLLRHPVSSVSVESLLPRESVIEGDRFELDRDALCSVLNLTSIDQGKVTGEVVEITDEAVRFKLAGELEASVEGVDTELRLVGKLTFDRRLNLCSWLALAVHETRQISRAEPGFDITATIRMVRRPLGEPIGLPKRVAQIDFDRPIPADRMFVEIQSRELGVGTMMDRRWRMVTDAPGSAVIRMVEHDISIAQCNLRRLVTLPEGKRWTMEAFQADIRQALGDQLQQIVDSDQRETAQGLDVLRVVADGQTKGVPIRWIFTHFADETGQRLQATFTMSGEQVEAFAANDVQFADSLRFLDPEDVHRGQGGDAKEIAAASENGPPADRFQSAREQAQLAEKETLSASDLR